MKKIISLFFALFMVLSLISCQKTEEIESSPISEPSTDNNLPSIENTDDFYSSPTSYDELIEKLQKTASDNYSGYVVSDSAEVEAINTREEIISPTESKTTDSDYSQTNVQVAGIDEGDIVKTDGKYIYVLTNDGRLVILKANGGNTCLISSTVTTQSDKQSYNKDTDGKEYAYDYFGEYASDMYIVNGKAAVIINRYETHEAYVNDRYQYSSITKTIVRYYDVSVPESPRITKEYSQDGNYISSRLTNDSLFVISDYYINDNTSLEEGGAVPYYGNDCKNAIIPLDSILYTNNIDSTVYTVISKYSSDGDGVEDILAILGGTSNIYMSSENLYLTSTRMKTNTSEEYSVSIYSVVDYSNLTVTDITKIPLSGELFVTAVGEIDGSLLNQFSLDEYNGYLRAVSTVNNYSYSTYTDTEMDFVNYKYSDTPQTNSLYVLDSSLACVGSITGLAESERIYSVRFSGDVGYFVTFRQTDPLFAVNLSDPSNPFITGELKIPGFSNYLHNFSDNLLFGLGYNADENGRTDCMKLSMFDTSDPYNVKEIATELLENVYYSDASYNHKAILISEEKNLIGFPSNNGYLIYKWDNNRFVKVGNISITSNNWYWEQARGIYINDCFYIVSQSETRVLDINNFTTTAVVNY